MRRFFRRKRNETQDEAESDNGASGTEESTQPESAPEIEETAAEDVPAEAPGGPTETALMDDVLIDEAALEEGVLMVDEDISDLTRPMETPIIEQTAVSMKPARHEPVPQRFPLLNAVQHCDVGRVRSRNEDSTFIFTAEAGGQEPLTPFGLYIVADGMGGHHAGHEASRNVSRLVAQYVLERIYSPVIKASVGSSGVQQEPIGEVMQNAVQTANKRIHNNDPDKESGTTLTAALIIGRRLYVAHVGDSRAYLLVEGELRQITKDHSYIQRLQDTGQITEEEAAVHPQRNVLYRAVGQGGELEIDSFTQTLPERGQLIICSDGLWGLVSNDQLQGVLNEETSLHDKASRLVDMALRAGGHDNVSVVLADFSF